MLLTEKAPDHSDIFNNQIERYGREGTTYAQKKTHHPKAVQGKGLDHTEHVHVDVDSANEGAQKVNYGGTGDGTEAREDDV